MSVTVEWRLSCRLVGVVVKWFAGTLTLPIAVALYYGESPTPFVVTAAACLLGGLVLEAIGTEGDLGPREGLLMVAASWFVVPLLGAVPFLLVGTGTTASPVNALFESMSGVSTTGATVFLDFDVHPRSLLMWRQMLQWIGGLGILVIATAILSELGVGGAQLMETESQTRTVRRLTTKISSTARIIWGLYIGLTVLHIAVLYALHLANLAPNMTLFNAVAHPLSSISTAGFSPEPESVMAFSPAVQWAFIPFMIVGATNFVLMYGVIKGEYRRLFENQEFRFYLGVLGFFTGLTAAFLLVDTSVDLGFEPSIRAALFNVVSIVTTTGYANVDFDLWSESAKHLLFSCMFVGGMAGSTTCSIKTLRWLVVIKGFRRDLFTAIHPEAIRPVRLSGGPIDERTVRDIYAFILISVLLFFLLTVIIVTDAARVGLDIGEFEAMGAAAATFFNIGPAFGLAGPFGSYEPFPATTKVAMIVLMWVGRIEIIPVLVLFTAAFWRS